MKPILFNTEMVRAFLAGQKTQTRRIVKPQPQSYSFDGRVYIFDEGELPKPQYQPGDVLYVRETWAKISDWSEVDPAVGIPAGFIYRADWPDGEDGPKWRPSIHMPKAAARIFLRVTDVRVERLWDISPRDVKKEGIVSEKRGDEFDYEASPEVMDRFAFEEVWDRTIKKADHDRYGWDANPWVWVYTFKRCGKEGESWNG